MKNIVRVSAIVAVLFVIVVFSIYGTVSPCSILLKKFQSRITQVSSLSVLADSQLRLMVEPLGPIECIERLLTIDDRFAASDKSSMKSDLRSVSAAQLAYFDKYEAYAHSIYSLDFEPSPGVIIKMTGTSAGWLATATHTMIDRTCVIFFGEITPPSPETTKGVVQCD